jgi:aminoglycoside phosphotransferase (APT) family kinase protein
MIFHEAEPRVQAVLDWSCRRSATHGRLHLSVDAVGHAGTPRSGSQGSDIPSLEEAAQVYCDVTKIGIPDLNWYFAYNLFRLTAITKGIAGRIREGTAANAKAIESAKRTVPLSQASWAYAQKAGAL